MFTYHCLACKDTKSFDTMWIDNPDRLDQNLPVMLHCDNNVCTGVMVYKPDKYRVDIKEIDYQRALGWPDFDPEDYCHRCGCRNCVWWTDSDRFNLALGAHGVDPDWAGIICIACFVELHKEKTNLKTVWKLVPDMFKGI